MEKLLPLFAFFFLNKFIHEYLKIYFNECRGLPIKFYKLDKSLDSILSIIAMVSNNAVFSFLL